MSDVTQHILLIGHETELPSSWHPGTGDARVVRLDLSHQTYRPEAPQGNGELISLNEVHFTRRRVIAEQVVENFFSTIAGRDEEDVLAPYRSGLTEALSTRCAVWALMHDLEAAELPDTATLVLRDESAVLRHGRDWLLARGNVELVDAKGKRTPLSGPPSRPMRPLGTAPARAILSLEETVGLPAAFRPEGSILAMTNLAHGTHSVTLAPIVTALRETEPVLLLNTAPRSVPDMPEFVGVDALKLEPLQAKALAGDLLRLWANGDGSVPIELQRLFLRVVQLDLPKMIMIEKALATIAAQGGRRAVLLSTTDSHWLSNFARERAPYHAVHRTTVQNAFVSASKRYTAPITDRLLAIDEWSMRFMAETFDIPVDTMEVVGSVRYGHLPAMRGYRPEGDGSKESFLSSNGFADDALLVALAGQPEKHSAGVQSFAEAMAERFGGDDRVAFALRLHPKEMPDVVERLKAFLAESDLRAAIDERPIDDFLTSADIVVTEHSNVGLEAGILAKPLIILKLPDGPTIPPLHEFGIGHVVESYDGCADALDKAASEGTDSVGFPDTSEHFATANPGLYHGNTVEAVLADIERARDAA